MEKHVNDKIVEYIHDFKTQLIQMIGEYKVESEMPHSNIESNGINIHQIINFINEHKVLHLKPEDFLTKRRTRNIVPYYDRCTAKIASNVQCTRRKKKGETLCGTHMKGIPHGMINSTNTITDKSVTVYAHDIKGIHYYLDEHENVYDTNDVENGVKNPRIIAKYVVNDGEYSIPSFNI